MTRHSTLRVPRGLALAGEHAPALVRRLRDPSGSDRGLGAAAPTEASLARWNTLLGDEARTTDVPPDLLRALCWYASGWRHFDPAGRLLATPAPIGTSYGCMQLNDHWHPDAFPAAMHDPQASIRYAATLLGWLFEQTGDWQRATMAFFGHDSRAERAARRVARYRVVRPWQERLTGERQDAGRPDRPPSSVPVLRKRRIAGP